MEIKLDFFCVKTILHSRFLYTDVILHHSRIITVWTVCIAGVELVKQLHSEGRSGSVKSIYYSLITDFQVEAISLIVIYFVLLLGV